MDFARCEWSRYILGYEWSFAFRKALFGFKKTKSMIGKWNDL